MSSYNFQDFKSAGSGYKFDGIRLMKSYIGVTKQTQERMVGVDRVLIAFDKKAGAIILKPNTQETESYKIQLKQSGSFIISCPLYREMPMTRYYFKEKIDEGFIFVKGQDVDK